MRTHTQPPTDHTTGAELQTLREAAGLTREALAELVGPSRIALAESATGS